MKLFRDEFEHVEDDVIFLNHCGVSPISKRCAEAMQNAVKQTQQVSEDLWPRLLQTISETRKQLASLLHAEPSEFAFTTNTTEGINWVANGIDWQPDDRIISINGEYPANIYPWMRLQEKYGVDFHLIDPIEHRVTPERIEQAINQNTRLVTLSFVDFVSGYRADVENIGELCRSHNIYFMVDLIQGAGALPVDLKKAKVDFAAGGAQKWLIGPQGIGYFYCAKERLNGLQVTNVGAASVQNVIPYREYDFTLRSDATRFMYGTIPTVPLYGFNAALSLLLDAGGDYIASRIKLVTDTLVDGMTQKGFTCHSPRSENEWSGIVIFSHPKHDPKELADHLWQHKIFAREREGYLRVAPHFYNTEEEIETLMQSIEKL